MQQNQKIIRPLDTQTQHPNEHRNDSEHVRCPEVELGCNKIKILIRPPEVDLGILGFIIRAIAKRQIPKPTSGHLKKTNDGFASQTKVESRCNEIRILIRPLDTSNCTNMTAMIIFRQAEF